MPWQHLHNPHYFSGHSGTDGFYRRRVVAIILLSGFFIGAVMVLQTGSQFIRFGQTSLTAMWWRLRWCATGPAFTGLLVTGRARRDRFGTRVHAGDGASGRDAGNGDRPSRKLVAPRLLAALLMLRC